MEKLQTLEKKIPTRTRREIEGEWGSCAPKNPHINREREVVVMDGVSSKSFLNTW